jgi:two-component system, cell cycle sensor histidine kinase and response regulator CckA
MASTADTPPGLPHTEALARTLDALPIGAMLLDRDGVLLWQNQSLRATFGLGPDEISPALGKRVQDLPNLSAARPLLQRVLEGQPLRAALLEFTTLAGRTLSLSLDSGRLPGAEDAAPGEAATWVLLRNLAQRDPLAGRLRKAQQMEFVGVAVAGVIHDLNNILTALGGTVELMRAGEVTGGPLVASLDGMLRRSRDITRQLLRAARATSTGLEPLDLRTPVRQSYDLFRHGFDSRMRFYSDLPPYQVPVQGDRAGLLQALFNLGVNARDAMKGDGELHLDLEVVADRDLARQMGWKGDRVARVRVWDTGPGIAPDKAEQVFEPFFSTKGEHQNTGMGLSVVRRAILDHGGLVRVLAKPGRGATFEILLPLFRGAVEDDEPTRALSLPSFLTTPMPPLKGLKVLVADDEPALRMMLDDALRTRGAEVESVPNGPDAVALMREHLDRGTPFRAALIDMQLPGLPGGEVIQQARAADPDIRLVATSGLEPDPRTQDQLKADKASFLPKPFRLGEVVDALLGR